jgi:hypothetical protein
MPNNLLNTQKEFIEKIFQYKAFPAGLNPSYPAERFNVYRLSIFENCRRALELTFPYVWQALEENNISANNIVGHFLKDINHWPTSGCLDDWGGEFPDFLLTIPNISKELRDLAKYEWLCNVANFSPVVSALSAEELSCLSESEQINFTFQFQPSFFMHYTTFPLGTFIKELPNNKAHWVIVIRADNQIFTYEIKEEWARFYQKLQEKFTLMDANEAIISTCSDFELASALAFLFEKRLCQRPDSNAVSCLYSK